MIDTKQWYYSKTVWGAIVAILASLVHGSGLTLDAGVQDQLADNLLSLTGAIGGLVAIYGRMTAAQRLG